MNARVWRPWRSLVVMLLVAFASTTGSQARAQSSATSPHLSVELLPPVLPARGIAQSHPRQLRVWIYYNLEPGWHIYWSNAGDSGEAPTAEWHLPPGFRARQFDYPAPRRLPLGPLMDFGYENQVAFPLWIDTPKDAASYLKPGGERLPLRTDLTWLVCRQACIPGKAALTLALPAGPESREIAEKRSFAERQVFPRPLPPRSAVLQPTAQGFTLALKGVPSAAEAEFFPSQGNVIANAAPQTVTARRDGFSIALKKDENLKDSPSSLGGVMVLGDGTAYLVNALPSVIPVDAAASTGGAGWLRYAAFALLGGIILNLMPCVFPVLFIKALALVQSSTTERRAMRTQGLMYTLGILVSFWTVVGVLLVLRAGGRQLGWGFQFQSPVFVAMIALLLFFLALSLAGMFEIGLSATSAGSSLANKHGLAGSFFTGVLAMVVATPCTAPFMGAAIGFALAQSAVVTFTVFTALGLGLAMPYLLLAFQPAWTRLLPRPGAWMEVLKQATAVPIFATVIWLVWLFAQTAGANALIGLMAAFLLLGIAGWVLGRWPARTAATLVALAIVALAVAAPVYAVHSFPAPQQASAAHTDHTRRWEPFTADVVAKYQAQGRPVFVDFTADWCLSCQVNERVVLERPEILAKLQDGKIALVRADWTRHDESIARALAALGRSGVPTYALYPGTPGAPAQVLPEVLTTSTVLDALKALPEAGTSRTASLHPSR